MADEEKDRDEQAESQGMMGFFEMLRRSAQQTSSG